MSKLTEQEIRNIRAEALIVAEDHEHRERKYHGDMTADGCIRVPARVLVSLCDALLSDEKDDYSTAIFNTRKDVTVKKGAREITIKTDGTITIGPKPEENEFPFKVGNKVVVEVGAKSRQRYVGEVVKVAPDTGYVQVLFPKRKQSFWYKAQDVELLKEPQQSDDCPFKVQDYVTFLRGENKGRVGMVVELMPGSTCPVNVACGEKTRWHEIGNLQLVTERPFKVGDAVEITGGTHMGRTGRITKDEGTPLHLMAFQVLPDDVMDLHSWCHTHHLALLPSKEHVEFELGDRVKVRADSKWNRDQAGRRQRQFGIGTITAIRNLQNVYGGLTKAIDVKFELDALVPNDYRYEPEDLELA